MFGQEHLGRPDHHIQNLIERSDDLIRRSNEVERMMTVASTQLSKTLTKCDSDTIRRADLIRRSEELKNAPPERPRTLRESITAMSDMIAENAAQIREFCSNGQTPPPALIERSDELARHLDALEAERNKR